MALPLGGFADVAPETIRPQEQEHAPAGTGLDQHPRPDRARPGKGFRFVPAGSMI
jgi:hypothetical protein